MSVKTKLTTALIGMTLIAGCNTEGGMVSQNTPQQTLASGEFDGRYSSSLAFEMGPATVCPSALPITIALDVKGSDINGVIINDGGENTHKFCALYHNGTITGKISSAGDLVNVKVAQKDAHSRQYSSYKISGNINGELELVSRQRQFHPNSIFSVRKSN